MDDVNVYIDELLLDHDGRDVTSSATEQILGVIQGPQARQIAASVDRAIAASIGALSGPGTT